MHVTHHMGVLNDQLICRGHSVVKRVASGVYSRNHLFLLVVQYQGVQIISLFIDYFCGRRSVTFSLSCSNRRAYLENWFKQFEKIVDHHLTLLRSL